LSKEPKYIRTDEAQVLLLDRLLAEIRNVKTGLEKQIPEGIVEPLSPVTVTTARRTVQSPYKKPWFSVSVVNDGPSACFIIVNSEKSTTSPYILNPNETFDIDMGIAKIVDLVAWCDLGRCILRVRGVR